jgi:DNA-directed RNA polymerase specialized sigma24 family protein
VLTATGLACLLARLDPDSDRAALEYERLRRTLLRFFEWRGVAAPDVCADEALDRLALRLEQEVAVKDVRSYAHGIARLLLLEDRRQPVFTSIDEMSARTSSAEPLDYEDEQRRACLDRCLAGMAADSRSLLLRYYEGERHVKIANRRQLAASLGLSDNALRSRVQRLRDRLQECLEACRNAGGASPADRGEGLS